MINVKRGFWLALLYRLLLHRERASAGVQCVIRMGR
jgi:hypothetical protein